jgi:hypothetical protein
MRTADGPQAGGITPGARQLYIFLILEGKAGGQNGKKKKLNKKKRRKICQRKFFFLVRNKVITRQQFKKRKFYPRLGTRAGVSGSRFGGPGGNLGGLHVARSLKLTPELGGPKCRRGQNFPKIPDTA